MAILQGAEMLSAAELFPHQQSAWKRQSEYVASASPFYQQLWQNIRCPDDLRDLPVLPLSDKSQLRRSQAARPPFGDYLAAAPQKVNRLHRTSGTTGQAMNLALSARDCEITQIVGGRAQSAAGLTPEHVVVHCLNYQMWMGGLTDHLTLEQTGATVVPFGVGNSVDLVHAIREIGINAISCTPSYPAVLERVLAEHFPRMRPRDLGLKLGLFGGEAGLDDPALRQRIVKTWGMEPRNANYGVSDVFSNIAAQCEHDTRLHFLAGDVLFPELIEPDTGEVIPLESGSEGELVLTHLERECQPLVRFRTGDIIAVDETSACRCGRKGMRFRVIGRSDDMVVVRGINVFPTMIAAIISGFERLSGDYRIVLDQKPPHDYLPVQVELAEGASADTGLAAALEQTIKAKIRVTARIEILPHGAFPVTQGKTRRVMRTYP